MANKTRSWTFILHRKNYYTHNYIKTHPPRLMMLDILMCITFISEQNKYPANRFICQNFDNNRHIDNHKYKQLTRLSVISANIWYHLTWKMMLDIIMRITFLPVQNKYPASCFICQNFENKNKRYK